MTAGMRSRLFAAYLAVMAVAVGAYACFAPGGWWRVACQVAIGWAAAAAAVYGVRRYRPPSPGAWLLFAGGIASNAAGIIVDNSQNTDAYPTIADLFYFALYPCLVAGVVLLRRRRDGSGGRDWSVMLDSTTITTGLGLLSWVYVIRPAENDPSLSLLGHIVMAAYPIGDIVVLAMIVRLILGGAGRLPAVRFLLASLCTFLVGDVLWVVWFRFDINPSGYQLNITESIFLIAFALAGAGALHPSVRETVPTAASTARLSRSLLICLTAAALIAPAMLIIETLTGRIVDGIAIGLSCSVLFVLVVIRMSGLLRQVEIQSRQLRQLARVDALTGLPNRRAWNAELPLALERSRRAGTPLSVAIVDIDHFKRFNDTYGHPAGDRLLAGAATAWQGSVRAVDLVARYGGEEFVVLLPDAAATEAAGVIERLRTVTPAGQTFSAGLAVWDGREGSDELVTRADAALYRAKEAGRNRTEVADPDPSDAEPAPGSTAGSTVEPTAGPTAGPTAPPDGRSLADRVS